MSSSAYIHIPFCKYICSYCDFSKRLIKNQDIEAYLIALDDDIQSQIKDKVTLKTLYIGGGTPSALNLEQLIKLHNIITKYFDFEKDYEFTFELNPDDVNDETLAFLKFMKVNRISIGVQTVNDEILTELRREHTKEDVTNAVMLAKNYFKNVSIDLIFNLPNQTIFDINDSLYFIEQHKDIIKNVSYYSLIIESRAILGAQDLDLMDEEYEATIYNYIQTKLSELGYEQYEISNFAKPGFASMHNQVYWDNQNYYGFGLSASGYIGDTRYSNISNLTKYLKEDIKVYETTKLTNYDKLYETIMLGLRTTKGIDLSLVKDYKINEEYFEIIQGRVKIKQDKFFVANEAILSLLDQIKE